MNHLLQSEVEEQEAVWSQVAEETLQAQIDSHEEITRVFDAIHEQGGEIYAVAHEMGFVAESDAEEYLTAMLNQGTIIVYMFIPRFTNDGERVKDELDKAELHIRNGLIGGYQPNSPWIRDIIFP